MASKDGSPSARPWKLCGATKPFTYRGVDYVAKCTRYKGHKNSDKPNAGDHFDEKTKKSWKAGDGTP